MITSLVLAVLAFAPLQDARVTVRQPALRADVAFRKIGELFSVELSVGPDVGDDVVLVYLPDATLSELLDKTAKGLNASWEKTDDGWTLQRSDEQRQADTNRILSLRAEELQRACDTKRPLPELSEAELEKLSDALVDPDEDDYFGYYNAEDEWNLGERLLKRLVGLVKAEFLVSLDIGKRYVWALNDPRFQTLPLLKEMERSYVREAKAVQRVIANRNAAEKFPLTVSEGIADPIRHLFGIGEPLHALYLMAVPGEGGVELSLVAFDADGRLLFESTDFMSDWSIEAPRPQVGESAPEVKRQPTALLLEDIEDRGFDTPVSELIVEMIANMPETDLLTLDASDVLFTLAEALGTGVVAEINDSLYWWGLSSAREGIEKKSFPLQSGVDWLANFHVFRTIDDLTIVRPDTRESIRAKVDRDAVGKYAKYALENSFVDIDLLADMIGTDTSLSISEPDYLGLLAHKTMEQYNQATPLPQFMSAYTALSTAQRKKARSRDGITMSLANFGERYFGTVDYDFRRTHFWSDLSNRLGSFPDYSYRDRTINDFIPVMARRNALQRASFTLRLDEQTGFLQRGGRRVWEPNRDLNQLGSDYYFYLGQSEERGAEFLAETRVYAVRYARFRATLTIEGHQIPIEQSVFLGFERGRTYRIDELPQSALIEFWNGYRGAKEDSEDDGGS